MRSDRLRRAFCLIFGAVLLVSLPAGRSWPQTPAPATSPAQAYTPVAETAASCCGPVTPAGERLQQVLDGMHVEQLWQARMHIDWKTGVADRPSRMTGTASHTHCSAFAAAVGERLGVYLLRPPEHSQTLLASAQGRWFGGARAWRDGWRPVATPREAQALANLGNLVVIVYINPDPIRSGHIAIVRPAEKSDLELADEGPQTAQAGGHNFSSGTAVRSFAMHKDAWPGGVVMYAHATKLGSDASTTDAPTK